MKSDLTGGKPNSRYVSRLKVHLVLLAAVISYWILWLAPLVVCLGLGLLCASLWSVSAETAEKWGSLWIISLSLTAGWSFSAGVLFLVLCRRLPGIWTPGFQIAETPPGVSLNPGEAPSLFEAVERLRLRAGLRQPIEVWVDLSVNCTNLVYRPPGESQLRQAIVVGLSPLAALSAADFELLLGLNVGAMSISHWLRTRVLVLQALATQSPPRVSFFFGRFNYLGLMAALCGRGLKSTESYALGFSSLDGDDVQLAILAIRKIGFAFQRFWAEHVQMMMETGHMIPLLEGFTEYWMASFPNEPIPPIPAVSMLRSPAAIEARVTHAILKSNPTMDSISWNQAATALLTAWKDYVTPQMNALSGLRARDICGLNLVDIARQAFQKPGRLYDPDQLRLMGGHLLAVALALALARSGWEFLYSGPASPVAFCSNGRTLEPFRLLSSVLDGSTTKESWQAACSENGINDLALV